MEINLNSSKYALITRQAELITYVNSGFLSSYLERNVSNSSDTHLVKCIAETGASIKIIETIDNEKCIVQFVEFNNHVNIQLYECRTCDIVKVADDIWPYVISIGSPERRLRFVDKQNKFLWVLNLKVNDILSVPGDLFKTKTCFDCIIRYIGPVQELNPVGYFLDWKFWCVPDVNMIF